MEPDEPARLADGQPHATILVLHGIKDNKSSMLGLGRTLAIWGSRSVLIDLRAHGLLSGQWLTFGVRESQDLVQVMNDLAERGLISGRIGIFGASYGGAVALQTAAIDPRVRTVVTVATFTNLRSIVPAYVRRFAPFGRLIDPETIDAAIDEAGRITGFDPDRADPLGAIARTDAPVLLIHGEADRLIGPETGRALHAARAPAGPRADLWLVPGETHLSITGGSSGRAIFHRAMAFFDEQLRD